MTFLGLVVKDVAAATEFYTQKLGLKVNEKESIPNAFTQFATDGGAIFGLVSGFEQEGVNQTFDTALLVTDVDATYHQWQAAGVEMVGEPHDMPFGRTFLCRTPDGHVLRVYSQPSAS
jgi:predicted enzyme related to lactoylglutathione lyase